MNIIKPRLLAAFTSLAIVAGAGLAVSGQAKSPEETITLYNGEGLTGAAVTISNDVTNLQSVEASEGFDGTANDYAYSLRAVGRWQVCMDAGYTTDCMEVDGDVSNLGERGGSISSIRYIGPSNAVAAASDEPKAKGKNKQAKLSKPGKAESSVATAPAAPEWQPMFNTDLYGSDYHSINYSRPGSNWQMCKASCDGDRQCRAWSYVQPGRTEFGECFLKNEVPEMSESDCCISGVKGTPSSTAMRDGEFGSRAVRRIGERSANALEDEVGRAAENAVRSGVNSLFDN